MQNSKIDSLPLGIRELLGQVTIRSRQGIRAAAEAMREAGLALGGFRVAACANIASKDPMVDDKGLVLASDIFGWDAPDERWWERPGLALTSPLTIACRYESEPFWCSKSGIHTQQVNPHLSGFDLSAFSEWVMTEVAIVVPIHLPYGQIGAVSFHPVGEVTDLSREFAEYGDLLGFLACKFIGSYTRVADKQQWIPSDPRPQLRHHPISHSQCRHQAECGESQSGDFQGGAAGISGRPGVMQRWPGVPPSTTYRC
jgi:LuxR family quorum-sensing system transcriptional regulator CciR